jgi:hypothetical protein
MFGERIAIIVNSMLVYCSVGMPMNHDMTMITTIRVTENKAEVIVAGVACRRFRSSDKYALDGEGNRRRHHYDASHPLTKCLCGRAQRTGSSHHLGLDTAATMV